VILSLKELRINPPIFYIFDGYLVDDLAEIGDG
jgi:hypothetical protein